MIIWIKEFCDILTLENIQNIFNDNVVLKKFNGWDKINNKNDLLLYSEKDAKGFSPEYLCIKVENFQKNLDDVINNDIQQNYDLYYLQNVLNFAKNNRIDNLFIGTSYMIHGISEDFFPYSINASLPSEDLYYSLKIIKEIIKNNQIKNIVLGMSIFSFHWDLSLTGFPELKRVSNVYYPLFKDYHNAVLITKTNEISLNSNILNVNKIYNKIKKNIGIHYFNQIRSRESCKTLLWDDKNKKWSELDKEIQKKAAYERAQFHISLLKYNATFNENYKLFNELIDLCNKQNINLNIVVSPVTKYYAEAIDEESKMKVNEVFENTKLKNKILDLFADPRFDDSDFVDMDHLNDAGAIKFSQIISDCFKLK